MKAPTLILALAVVAGCDVTATLQIGFPPAPDAGALLVAVEQGDDLRAFAYPAGDVTISVPAVIYQPSARLFVLAYERSLEELGLATGELRHVEVEPRRALPSPKASYVAEIVGGKHGGWAAIEPKGVPSLSGFRVAGSPPSCAPLRIMEVLRQPFAAVGAFPLDGGDVLAVSAHAAARFSLQGGIVTVDFGAPIGEVKAATLDNQERLWIGDQVALFMSEPASLGFRRVSTSSTTDAFFYLQAHEDASGLEVFSLMRDGKFTRFDGRAFEPLRTLETDLSHYGGLVRLGSGDVIVVTKEYPKIVRYADGVLTEIDPPVADQTFGFCAAGAVPGIGTVLVDRVGYVHILDEGSIRVVGMGYPDTRVVTPYEKTFAISSRGGQVSHYRDSDSLCDIAQLPGDVRALAAFGSGLLAGAYDGEQTRWFTLEK